jgi:uncharacterized glyoxalase superfamily protein PhnB
VTDEIDPVRRLRPDRVQATGANDPWLLAEERNRLMSRIEQTDSEGRPKWPAMYPRISYLDEMAAIEFLTRAFGFRERREARMDGDPEKGWGALAWLELGDGVVMVGRVEHEVHQISSPAEIDGRFTCMIQVAVHDIDAHYARAQAEGAEITMEIEDAFYGYRRYEARDPEGHKWHFNEPLSEIAERSGT